MDNVKGIVVVIAFIGLLVVVMMITYTNTQTQPQPLSAPQAVAAVRGGAGPTSAVSVPSSNAVVDYTESLHHDVDSARKAAKIQEASNAQTSHDLKKAQHGDQ